MPNNPYANAAGAYGDNAQKNTPDQSELEARVLLKANKMLQDLKKNWDESSKEVLEETLKYNRQLWMLFYDTASENPEGNRPNDLRSNIINLANFIFKREVEILSAPEPQKLDAIININREIAAGLMDQQKQKRAEKNKNDAPSKEEADSSTDNATSSKNNSTMA